MSARIPICLLVLACLLTDGPVHASANLEYLKVVEIREVIDDRGYVDFVIVVQNTHPYLSANTVRVSMALKKDGVVIHVMDNYCSGFGVGKTCEHTFDDERKKDRRGYTKDDYDSVEGRVASANFSLSEPDRWLLTGELSLVEESLNIDGGDDYTVIMGEIHNGTNAVLKIERLVFGLWDAEDNFLGLASEGYGKIGTIWPGETPAFWTANNTIPFEQVARYEMDVEYVIARYVEDDIATTAKSASWGQIKARR